MYSKNVKYYHSNKLREKCAPGRCSLRKYRAIKMSLCTWWLQHTFFLPHYLAESDCLAADRQGQGDTRHTLTPSVIPNYGYVVTISDWNCLKYFCVFFCTVIIRCTETFWSYCTSRCTLHRISKFQIMFERNKTCFTVLVITFLCLVVLWQIL
jgi:hypothetical protein